MYKGYSAFYQITIHTPFGYLLEQICKCSITVCCVTSDYITVSVFYIQDLAVGIDKVTQFVIICRYIGNIISFEFTCCTCSVSSCCGYCIVCNIYAQSVCQASVYISVKIMDECYFTFIDVAIHTPRCD